MKKKNHRNKRKSYRFGTFARFIVGLILPKKYNMHFYYDNEVKELQPPYFIIANHTSFWDPFIVALGAPEFVNHVANDEYFRFPVLAFFMKLLGAVPKTKQMSDYETVKSIIKMKEANDVICIFAEGGRQWQGETQPLLISTSKLIKKLKIPVVVCMTKGGSTSFPRWGRKFRKGVIETSYQVVLHEEEIDKMSYQDIHELLTYQMAFNETTWNKEKKYRYKGRRLAEHLEWYIYACPHCHGLEIMTSHKNTYTCQCGYSVKYNEYGLFEQNSDIALYADNTIDWNNMQVNILKDYIESASDDAVLIEKINTTVFTGIRKEPKLKLILKGTLVLKKTGITLFDDDTELQYNYQDIQGVITNHKNVIDFYQEDQKVRFQFEDEKTCGYIIEDIIKLMKKRIKLQDQKDIE